MPREGTTHPSRYDGAFLACGTRYDGAVSDWSAGRRLANQHREFRIFADKNGKNRSRFFAIKSSSLMIAQDSPSSGASRKPKILPYFAVFNEISSKWSFLTSEHHSPQTERSDEILGFLDAHSWPRSRGIVVDILLGEKYRDLALTIFTFAKNCSNTAHWSNKVSKKNAVCPKFCENLIENRLTGDGGSDAADALQLNGVDWCDWLVMFDTIVCCNT